MRSDSTLKAVAQTPNSIEQTVIARMNQVQDVNALISVSVGDRHNNVQIRSAKFFSAVSASWPPVRTSCT